MLPPSRVASSSRDDDDGLASQKLDVVRVSMHARLPPGLPKNLKRPGSVKKSVIMRHDTERSSLE